MNYYPKCCYCNYEFDDDETWYNNKLIIGNGDESELKCPSCGKEIVVLCDFVPMFLTTKIED